jgi:nicotinamidase-related amidase
MITMNTALLLIDIQNDYFKGGTMELAGSDKASDRARLLLQKFRKDNLPVVHIQHIATKPSATFFLPGTKGAEIHDSVKPEADEKLIVKHYPNSFRETELLDYLKGKNISTLVVCGMMTHMCVDATVRAAKDFGFNCIAIGDACATRALEIHGERVEARDVHNSFIAALNGFYSEVKTTSEYLAGK